MTKEEAKQALIAGERVRHDYYSDGEWLEFNNAGYLVTEDGYHKGKWHDEFWTKYQWWEDGWHIVNKN